MKYKDKNFWKTQLLINKVNDIEYILTDNEIEAFLLESNLIKRYRPIYNIELKDQQRYTYLKITDEKYPRLLVARRNRKEIFKVQMEIFLVHLFTEVQDFCRIGMLRKIFKIRICDRLPTKPCLEYFIHNCDAPCINNISEEKYLKNIKL